MSYIPMTEYETSNDEVRKEYDDQISKHGRITNMKRTLLRCVPAFKAYMEWYTLYDLLVPVIGERAISLYSYAISKPKMIKSTAETIISPVTSKVEAKMSEISKIIENATPAIPNELSLVPSKNITEAYIQRKKNKLMFYRLFNFIPRELTGNGKKNKGIFSGLWK